jgi:hypothetical protein
MILNHPAPLRNASARTTASLIVASAVLALLLISEISGLSSHTLRLASNLVLAATALLVAVAGRSGQEAMVFGQMPVLNAGSGGSIAGLFVLALLLPFLTYGVTHLLLAAAATGLGIFLGSYTTQKWRRDAPLPIHPIIGALMTLMGSAILLIAFPIVVHEFALLSGQSKQVIAGLVLCLGLIALTFGGWRGALTLTGAATTIIFASAGLAVAIGVQQIGPPPLPLFIDTTILEQITALRQAFALKSLPFPEVGSQIASITNWFGVLALFFASAFAAGMFMQPAVEDQPVTFGLSTAVAVALVGCFAIAIGGYALEAAAREFFGNPISQPASGLLATARQGLATICGSQPGTEDQLLTGCKVTALSKALLSVDQVRLDASFLAFGLPHALGLGMIGSLLANLWKPLLSLVLTFGGLVVFVTGIGRHLFGYKYQKPGLASFRIALMRVATVVVLALTAGLLPHVAPWQGDHAWRVTAVLLMAMTAIVAAVIAMRSTRPVVQATRGDAIPTRPQRPDFQEDTPAA